MRSSKTELSVDRPLARPSTDDRMEIMLACAASLFQVKGYEGTSMQDIADRVGLTKAALYHYVSSKQDLLYGIHDAFVTELSARTEAYFGSTDDPLDKLKFVAQEIARTIAKFKPYVTVSFQELGSLPPERFEEISKKRDAYEALVQECVTVAIAEKKIRSDLDPRLVSLFLFGACNWMYQWYREDGPLSPDEVGAMFFDMFFLGVAADGVSL